MGDDTKPNRRTLVIPCYNEAARLDRAAMLELARSAENLTLLFVDDGSKDQTKEVLAELERAEPERVSHLVLPQNRGKAEAVRAGLRLALERGSAVVGYADADLATPGEELLRLFEALDRRGAQVVLGSRWKHLGSQIERQWWRHYLGRVFATLVSTGLRLGIYDSQCGAKVFRDSPALRYALDEPFHTRWVFDVELIGRLLTAPSPLSVDAIIEVPLEVWIHKRGSKLDPAQMAKAGLDLARVLADVERRRRRQLSSPR